MASPGPVIVETRHDVPWMPRPNRVETILARVMPPAELCTTALVLPFDAQGNLLLAFVKSRGVDIIGGHIEHLSDRRETPVEALLREAREEAGASIASPILIGYQRLVRPGMADGFEKVGARTYPVPVGFQLFFAARLLARASVAMPEECGDPVLVSRAEALSCAPVQRFRHFYEAAIEALQCPGAL